MCVCLEPSRGRGGGYSGVQGTGMIEWGKNQNPPKSLGLQTKPKAIPGPKFNQQKKLVPSHKNFHEAFNDITITNLQIVLHTQNNPYLNQAVQEILAKLFLPKQISKSKI